MNWLKNIEINLQNQDAFPFSLRKRRRFFTSSKPWDRWPKKVANVIPRSKRGRETFSRRKKGAHMYVPGGILKRVSKAHMLTHFTFELIECSKSAICAEKKKRLPNQPSAEFAHICSHFFLSLSLFLSHLFIFLAWKMSQTKKHLPFCPSKDARAQMKSTVSKGGGVTAPDCHHCKDADLMGRCTCTVKSEVDLGQEKSLFPFLRG